MSLTLHLSVALLLSYFSCTLSAGLRLEPGATIRFFSSDSDNDIELNYPLAAALLSLLPDPCAAPNRWSFFNDADFSSVTDMGAQICKDKGMQLGSFSSSEQQQITEWIKVQYNVGGTVPAGQSWAGDCIRVGAIRTG